MDNESIAAAAIGTQQAMTSQKVAIAALKSNFSAQQNVADSLASNQGRVGEVIDSGRAVMQAGRILDQSA